MMTEQELARFVSRMDKEIAREYKTGTVSRYSGNLGADIAD